jgi:hypothetical protein
MGGLLVQFLGLFALLGIAAWGYRHWISPRQVGIQGKGMLLLCVVTLVGGLLGSTGWWIDDPRSFSWDLPPPRRPDAGFRRLGFRCCHARGLASARSPQPY